MTSPLVRARAADAVARAEAKATLKDVFTDQKDAVLTFRQRDCVVQYICEVRRRSQDPHRRCFAPQSQTLLPPRCKRGAALNPRC